jgi:hypothetical protein
MSFLFALPVVVSGYVQRIHSGIGRHASSRKGLALVRSALLPVLQGRQGIARKTGPGGIASGAFFMPARGFAVKQPRRASAVCPAAGSGRKVFLLCLAQLQLPAPICHRKATAWLTPWRAIR